MITSTWGSESLAGRHPGLPAELLAQLPVDEYRVALILHPNVWSGHGAWQIGVLQRTAVEAGLTTVDPADGWQQALTAADLVIGDHGSVTVYAAAIGRPVLLAAFGPEAVPNTAGWALRTVAPWLDTARPLAAQIETALTDHRPDRYEPVTAEAFGVRGQALPRLRETVYDLLDLAQPKQPARTARAFGLPAPGAAPPRSLIVGTTLTGRQDQAFEVDLQRFPAVLAGEPVEREDSFQHLACDVDEPDTRLTESATVLLVRSCVFASDDGRRRTIELLADFPGARLAAVSSENGCLVGLRDGTTLEVSSPARPCPDPGAAAAAVYTCLRLGVAPHGITVTLRSGTSAQELSLRALGPAGADQSPASRARTSTARGLPASS
ncbi:hypothetical protein [Kitasatospora albolonga]|uniref:hypothetical protein n=1 Tax=Kitasatospora albolonga TaxID=68173 RepID=UPI0031EEF965